MKNHITLVIASLLLILCVVEKEASVKDNRKESVEKMYNIPTPFRGNSIIAAPFEINSENSAFQLYNPAPYLELASIDSTSASKRSSKTLGPGMLGVSTITKVLD
jgi:hypothetical protein